MINNNSEFRPLPPYFGRWVSFTVWIFVINNAGNVQGQFNIYGVNLELIKMRLTQQPFYVQQYQLQVDYTHSNKVIDYGVVSVGGVQDQTDFIFIEAINRNPFHLAKVEVRGDVCFRLFVQNGDILFDECTQIRDLPSNNAYYNSKYVTRTKNDGALLMYKFVQHMVENRDETRALLEQSFVNAQLNGILGGSCQCTTSVVIASFEGAIILIALLYFAYWKFGKLNKKNKKASTCNNTSLDRKSRLENTIYADNAITTTSIAWDNSPSPAFLRPSNATLGTYYASNPVIPNVPQSPIIINPKNLGNNIFGQRFDEKLAVLSRPKESSAISEERKAVPQVDSSRQESEVAKRISKSILEQIIATNKKMTSKFNETKDTINPTSSKQTKNRIKTKINKKIPPDPPPPDYKNDGFDDEDEEEQDSTGQRNKIQDGANLNRIYDRLESQQ